MVDPVVAGGLSDPHTAGIDLRLKELDGTEIIPGQ